MSALSQHCAVTGAHATCPGETTLGTSACECSCHSIVVGSRWIAAHAKGRHDPIVFTVRGVTARGVYITSPESRSPGNLIAIAEFRRLYVAAP